ncbi:hypothetical protein CAAN1_03S02652 [[Candida] anglica]|uniref:RRM domain-containing protein n=1 Tax=[Candida] anglica TaxID=148631 RepID=A0ABP0EGS2_9ASCO
MTSWDPIALEKSVQDSPYDNDAHNRLISCLRGRLQDNQPEVYEELEKARLLKLKFFVLSQSEINNWIEDIKRIEDHENQTKKMLDFYRIVISDYPVVRFWKPYLELQVHSKCSDDMIKQSFTDALLHTVHDYKDSDQIWHIVLEYFEKVEPFESALKLHLKRLSYPHRTLQQSFEEFSAFISRNDAPNYEKHVVTGNKLYSKSCKSQRYYDIHEIRLAKLNNPQLWIEYIGQVGKYSSDGGREVTTLFERAVAASITDNASSTSPWISLWLSFIYLIYDPKTNFTAIESILSKFVRVYPYSSKSYAEYIRNCPLFENGNQKFLVARDRFKKVDVMHSDNYDDWKILALSVLSYEISEARSGGEDEDNLDIVDILYEDATEFVEFATNANNDAFHTIEKLTISIFEELGDLENARIVVGKILQKFSDQSEVWLYSCEFEKRHGADPHTILKILESAVDNAVNLDWPERIIQEWLVAQQIYTGLDEYKASLLKANTAITLVNVKRLHNAKRRRDQDDEEEEIEQMKEVVKNEEDKMEEEEAHSKRQKLDIQTPDDNLEEKQDKTKNVETIGSHRNREKFTIRVSNLPQEITEKTLIEFFKECGQPKEIKIIQESDRPPQATVEFSNQQEVFAAITRDMKKIGENEVRVTQAETATVWVTNFPPGMTHEEIKEYFSGAGQIVGARFPSLKFNQNRRFCYIEYTGSEIAKQAVSKFNGQELNESGKVYHLVVKISRPEVKQDRRINAADEGREIFIQNLDFKKVSSNVLEELFAKFGEIEKVSLPAGKGNGQLNNGYGFVTFKSNVSANNAIQADGSKVEGRPIKVSIAQSVKQRGITTTNKNINTISILNLDDTVNSEQIKKFASKVGPVKSVDLHPGIGALVEYENVTDSGRASMVLSGEVFEGNIVEIGTTDDLKRKVVGAKANTKEKPKLMVPASVARRRKRVL